MKAVIVTGGRDFMNRFAVWFALDELRPDVIIHGGANGADTLAHAWAVANSVMHVCIPAQWTKHGRAAGPIRNALMLKFARDHWPDVVCVAFPGGKGTADMVRQAKTAGVEVLRRGEA